MDFYYYAVQGTIINLCKTYDEASELAEAAASAEEETLGDEYDYDDSLREYSYVRGGNCKNIISYKEGEGGHERAYSQINGGRYYHSEGDTFWGELPDWIKELQKRGKTDE